MSGDFIEDKNRGKVYTTLTLVVIDRFHYVEYYLDTTQVVSVREVVT